MGKKDPRVDAYIAEAAAFAQPILKHLRKVVHAACPEAEETMKWSAPHFIHQGMLCNMAAFKAHCSFNFWKSALIPELKKVAPVVSAPAMGDFGRITSVADLPKETVLRDLIHRAMKLNEEGTKLPARPKKEKKELAVPDYFIGALKKNKKALATFEAFSYSHKKEYVEWITEAKTEATRQRRMATALEWLAEGKKHHWKYAHC